MEEKDIKITLVDDKGKKYTIIQTEKIDMEKELNKIIARLLNNWNELKEWLKEKIKEDESYDDLISTDYNLWNLIEEKESVLEKMQEIESRK